MTITFTKLVSDCLVAAGDNDATTWPRATVAIPWVKEALIAFPILRPMLDDHTNGASVVYSYALPADYREVISVEYPINQQPPEYLARKNRLDPDFYKEGGYYDIDHDFSGGLGFYCYISGGIAATAHIKMQYLAQHDTNLADDSVDVITVPDQYENILVAYFINRAWRERLGAFMQDPTAHTSVIQQMTEMVQHAEENYRYLVETALERVAQSKISPVNKADKFDRVY